MAEHNLNQELAAAAGRFMIIGYEGRTFEPEIADLIETFRPAGLIFFARNYPDSPAALRDTLALAQKRARELTGRPLLTVIDHEGGLVQRLPAPFTKLSPARDAAEKLSSQAAGALAGAAGRELMAVGFNFNMAPVLDLAVPGSDFIGSRSFGASPQTAVEFGRAYLSAYAESGVLCAAKHFPGLGRAVRDPHLELPVITADRPTLYSEIAPFRALVRELPAIMTTHALYPALDPDQPATFSPKIAALLRDLGFEGALLTDDLEMGAVVKNRPMGAAAVDAAVAGHDLLLICRRREYLVECQKALMLAIERRLLTPERLAEADRRRAGLLDKIASGPPEEKRRRWFQILEGSLPPRSVHT